MRTSSFKPPFSGPILAIVIDAFALRRFDEGGALSTRTARRYLRGDRVGTEAEALVHAAIARAVVEAGYLPKGMAATDFLLVNEVSAVVFAEIPLHHALTAIVSILSHHWDTLVGVLRRRTAPVGHMAHALGACLRLVITDVTVRLTALLWLARDEHENPVPDFWIEDKGTSLWLRRLLEVLAPSFSRDRFAKTLKVHRHTVDGWLDKGVRPTDENLMDLANCLGAESDEKSEDILRRLRLVFAARDLLRVAKNAVGDSYAADIALRVASYPSLMLVLVRASKKSREETDTKMKMAITLGTLGRDKGALPWVESMLNHVWRQEPDAVWRTTIKAATRSWLEHLQDVTAKLGPRPSDEDFIEGVGFVPSPEAQDKIAYLVLASKDELARNPLAAHAMAQQAATGGYYGALELKLQALDAIGQRDPLRGIELLRRAVVEDPLNAEIHFRLGCSLWEIGDTANGLAELEIACQLAPDWDRCRVEVAIVLMNNGRYQDALARLREWRATLPTPSAWLLQHLGFANERLGHIADAVEAYEECLRHRPENGEVLDRLAHLYFRLNDKRKGAEAAKRAAEFGVETVLLAWRKGFYSKGSAELRPPHVVDGAFLQFIDSVWPESISPSDASKGQ